MPIENFTYINSLDTNNPAGTDPGSDLDNHVRGIKTTLKNTLPNVTGPVTATQAQLNNPLLATTPAANKLPYYNGTTTAATADLTAMGRTIIASANGTLALQAMGADSRYLQINVPNTANLILTGTLTTSGNTVRVEGGSPQMQLYDLNWGLRYVYHDGGLIGFLTSGGGWSFYNDNSGNTWQGGTAQAYDFVLNSDPELKENIKPISAEAARAFVSNVKGYTYKFKDQETPTSGVLSTEVAAAAPNLVSKDDKGFDRVSYMAMIGYLLADLEAAHKKIADLEGHVVAFNQFNTRLTDLERKVK